jgi:hydroxymethylbilane synthase
LAQRIRAVFETTEMLPAAGQGALGIEIKANRADLVAALAPLAHLPTWMAVSAERAVSRAMGGSCSMPLAAHAVWDGAQLRLNAAWGEPEEEKLLPVNSLANSLVMADLAQNIGDLDTASSMGEQVAAKLLAGGARKYTK